MKSGRLFFGYLLLGDCAPAFSAFATSLWLAAQKTNPPGADLVSTRRAKTREGFCSVTRLRVREPDLINIAIAIHYYLFSSYKK